MKRDPAQPYARKPLISLQKHHGSRLAQPSVWLDEKIHMRWHSAGSGD